MKISEQTITADLPQILIYPEIKISRALPKSAATQVLTGDSIKAEWKWEESKSLFKMKPYLEIRAQLDGFGFVNDLNLKTSDFDKTTVDGQEIEFHLNQKNGKIVVDTQDKKGKPLRVTLEIDARSNRPSLLIHKSCEKLGMNLSETLPAKGYLYTAIVCKKGKRGVYVLMQHDPLATISEMQPLAKSRNNRSVHFYRQPPAATDDLGRVVVCTWNVQAETTGMYKMVMTDLSHKRLSVTAGLAPTLISHTESLGDLKVTEFALSGKVAGTYILIPDLLDVGASIFGTLLPITSSPSHLPAARWIGVNARLGIMLPFEWWDARWSVLTGIYHWNMSVPNRSYGLGTVQGPQIFFTVSRFKKTRKSKAFMAYLKIAPLLADGAGFGFTNIDLALGGLYQINSLKAKSPLLLTIDIDRLKVKSVAASNTVSTFTFAAGLSFSLF